MKKAFFIFFLLITCSSFAQKFTYDTVWTFQMKVYNPLDIELTAIIKNKIPENGELPARIVKLAPKDTTEFPFILTVDADRVPEYDFDFSIYEAPSYNNFKYHGYWYCKRIVDDNYSCWHSVQNNIVIVDSLRSNNEVEVLKTLEDTVVYKDYAFEFRAKFDGDIMEMLSGASQFILDDSANIDVTMYVQFIVEIDGSLSEIEIIKPSNDKYNEDITNYFRKQQFIPAYRKGLKVRTRTAYPVSVRYLRD
ncbi:MAG: hypothetical protein ACI857_003362 [Arenicella sp.]|jgi:hypothetical protein